MDAYLVPELSEGTVLLRVSPFLSVHLLLGLPEQQLRAPQPLGQRLQLFQTAQQLPPDVLDLPLQVGLQLPGLCPRSLQLQAVDLGFRAGLLKLRPDTNTFSTDVRVCMSSNLRPVEVSL